MLYIMICASSVDLESKLQEFQDWEEPVLREEAILADHKESKT
jgi:hypothetical protein